MVYGVPGYLQPQQVGTWPTNVQATADYDDVLGNPGQLVFPIPEVEVYAEGAWSEEEPMPIPIHGAGAGVFDGGVLVPGGADVQGFAAIDTVQWLKLE